MTENENRPELSDTPPILGSWRNVYALVLGVLVLDVIVFFAITRIFS